MKKVLNLLLAVLLLAGLVTLAVPEAKAAEHTDHCVCGGSAEGVGGHSCADVQWQPLSDVVTLTAVDWKNVPGGNYYLDGDVTVTAVTDGYSIGSAVKNEDGTTYTTEAQQISLCLNGHSVTTKKDRVFKGIYTGSTLNICDCSGKLVDGVWQWDGTIKGGTSNNGGITYTYANSTTNIYGGNLTNTNTTGSGGGLFYVAQDRAEVGNTIGQKTAEYASTMNIYNGNFYGGNATKNGGNIYVAHYSRLNVYGGYIHDGTAGNSGGNIYHGTNCTIYLENANIYNGTAVTSGGNIYPVKNSHYTSGNIYGGSPESVHVVTVQDGQEVMSHEYSLANALKKVTADSYLKLMRDLTVDVEITGEVTIDMNGCDLSGVTVSGTLYGFDSATDSYTGDNAGKLSATVTGQVLAKQQYLMVNEDGYSFHRYAVNITHLSLKPANVAMGYKAKFQGDDAIARNVSSFGYEMWLDGYEPHTYSSKEFTSDKELTLRLQNILSEDNTLEENLKNAETKIYAKAFIQLNDGTKVSCDQVSYDFKEMLNLADDGYASYNAAQKAALQTLAGKFSETMMTWDVENFHHADGGMWTKVNHAGFLSKLTVSGSYSDVKAGSYVLTSDVNIGSRTLRIKSGTTVNICLNGYTISGIKRMMRIYGTLNLCDCHAHGEAEGGMTSSFTDTDGHGAVFYTYYGSTFNLYGGNLKATGTLATSGVGAVSHEAQSTYPDIAPGVMNMYGGTLSGGNVKQYKKADGTLSGGNGGLLSLFHGATFNMYGGELYGGHAEAHGGAIHVSGTSNLNLYGGSIHDCSADTNGGGLYLTGATQRFIGEDMTVRDNTALQNGGNIYLGSDSPLCVDGSLVTGGSAVQGGDIYVHGGQLELTGAVSISNLYMNYTSSLDADDMTADACVGFDGDVYGFLTNNTALTDCFVLSKADYEVKEVFGKLLAVKPGLEIKTQTQDFRVGHSSVCIDPAVTEGIPLSGFGNSAARLSTGVQESLYANATAITDAEGNTVILITNDLQRPQEAITNVIREQISRATGVPFENVILSASHSHSTPDLYSGNDLIDAYKLKLYNDFTQAAIQAMASRVSSNVETGGIDEVKTADGKYMNFTRHYYYYDENGVKQYYGDNFGTAPASADRTADKFFHVAEGDHSLQLIRFDRGEEKDVVLCNWAAHPTMTGGSDKYVISADYVGPLRDKVQAETDCYFSFVQGAAGNMNPTSRITNETPYTKAQYHDYGEALADFVIAGLNDMQSVSSGLVQTERYVYEATVFKHSEEEVAKAKEFNDLSFEERKAQYKEWGYTSIYHASSIISKANMGQTQDLELNVFSIGDSLGFYSLPGELWAESALKVKASSGFASTFTVGYSNGDWKYFVDGSASDGTYENYEYFYCRFVLPDTTQNMIEYWQAALDRLYQNVK